MRFPCVSVKGALVNSYLRAQREPPDTRVKLNTNISDTYALKSCQRSQQKRCAWSVINIFSSVLLNERIHIEHYPVHHHPHVVHEHCGLQLSNPIRTRLAKKKLFVINSTKYHGRALHTPLIN